MFMCHLVQDLLAKVTVHDDFETIRVGLGDFGLHLTRVEAIDLISQLEKAIHKTATKEVV